MCDSADPRKKKFYVKQVVKKQIGGSGPCDQQLNSLSSCWWRPEGEFITDTSDYIFVTFIGYLPLPRKAQCCSFVPPCCLQHNTGRHLPEGDWCKFVFAPLFRLHTVHCIRSSLQSHPIHQVLYLLILFKFTTGQVLLFDYCLIDWLTDWTVRTVPAWNVLRLLSVNADSDLSPLSTEAFAIFQFINALFHNPVYCSFNCLLSVVGSCQ